MAKLIQKLTDYNNPHSFASRLRTQRISHLVNLINTLTLEKDSVSILDIGGTKRFWNILPENFIKEKNLKITLINLPSEKTYEDDSFFTHVIGDACEMSMFDEKSFDIAHSNSVIEHVGNWQRMKMFAEAVRRIGKNYYIQTPNFWFPIEPHCMTPFFHWLPFPTRVWLTRNFSLGHWSKSENVDKAAQQVESANLLNKGMMKELFPDSLIYVERFFTLPKSLTAIKHSSPETD